MLARYKVLAPRADNATVMSAEAEKRARLARCSGPAANVQRADSSRREAMGLAGLDVEGREGT